MVHNSEILRTLVVQARTEPAKEQARMRALAAQAGVGKPGNGELTFVNPLRQPHDAWNPRHLLDGVGRVIFLGTSNIDHADPQPENQEKLTLYKNLAYPLYREVADKGMRGLAVCFGHQSAADALKDQNEGNEFEVVQRMPGSGELGTPNLHLTEDGKTHDIFRGLGTPIPIAAGHKDSVVKVPDGTTILGFTNGESRLDGQDIGDPHSALQIGSITTFQTHPEMTEQDLQGFATAHGDGLRPYILTHEMRHVRAANAIVRNFLTASQQ